MKKLTNIIGLAFFIGLLPFTWLSYLIMDAWEETKVNTDLPDEIKKPTFKTTYPEEKENDFNSWSQYINKLR